MDRMVTDEKWNQRAAPSVAEGEQKLLAIKEAAHEWAAKFPLRGQSSSADDDAARHIYDLCEAYDLGKKEAPEVTTPTGQKLLPDILNEIERGERNTTEVLNRGFHQT